MLDFIIAIPGPVFLVIFVIFELIALIFAYIWMNFADLSGDKSYPNLKDFDNVSLAALRGGDNAVIKTILFDMWQKGYIEIDKNGSFRCISSSDRYQDRLAFTIYNSLQRVNNVVNFFKDKNIKTIITNNLSSIYGNLERQGLIESNDGMTRAWQAIAVSGSLILIVGGTKLLLGLFYHRSIVFLIILIIIGFVSLFVITKPFQKYRPTKLGRQTIKRFQERYGWLKKEAKKKSKTMYANTKDIYNNPEHPELTPIFCIALFGLPLIAQDPLFTDFYNLFPKNASSGGCSGSGCSGGGCSSSGCSSSGCGGGCGGCGG